MLLQPLESLFDESVGLPADIWALGCTIFDICGKYSLFEASPYFRPSKDDVLVEMVDTLGMLPGRWWKKWEAGSRYFNSDGTQNTDNNRTSFRAKPRSLPVRLANMRCNRYGPREEDPEQMSIDDEIGLLKLLMSMLVYEPLKRATAEGVVKSEWVQQLLRDSEN